MSRNGRGGTTPLQGAETTHGETLQMSLATDRSTSTDAGGHVRGRASLDPSGAARVARGTIDNRGCAEDVLDDALDGWSGDGVLRRTRISLSMPPTPCKL